MTRFSVTGYSLGGLIARYVVGYVVRIVTSPILHHGLRVHGVQVAHACHSILLQRGFFENVTPVNLNTIATPHIGLPKYPTVISSLFSYLGPKLLSRTGEQFYVVRASCALICRSIQ